MKVYVITGNHPNMGHYMLTTPLDVRSTREDAEFSKQINELFGWHCIITEQEFDGKIHKDSVKIIEDAGIIIPDHMRPV